MLETYDFNDTLSRLEDINHWLSALGFTTPDRVRVYRRNIHKMIEVEASGGMDELAAAPIEKALNGPADLYLESAKNSDGRNFMFELTMGSRLAGAGLRPSFDKGPDVQVELAELQVGIQCKRPYSAAGLQPTIRKAIHQLEAGKTDLGSIAVSVSRLLNSGDPTSIPEVANHEDGHPYLQARILQIAQQTERFWSGKLHRTGILFYAFTPIRCRERPRYFPQRCEAFLPLGRDATTSTLLKRFAQNLNA